MKRKGLKPVAALIALWMLLSQALFSPLPAQALAIPTHESVYQRLSTIYEEALDLDQARSSNHRRMASFSGYCSHYAHLQLMLLGVYNSYNGLNGNQVYGYYSARAGQKTSGGMKIRAYPARGSTPVATALKEINSTCRVATNIILGFSAAHSSARGKLYGHAMLIHAVIDGYVYFTDNFGMTLKGVKYNQGDPIRCTIADFDSFYGRSTLFTYTGMIWFETEEITAAVNSGSTEYNPGTPGTGTQTETPAVTPEPINYTPGQYEVNYSAGLRIRAASNTSSATLDVLPDKYRVYVTAVENGFGKIFSNYGGKRCEGWISLNLTKRVGDLPPVCADTYDKKGAIQIREWFDGLEEANENAAATAALILYSDCILSHDITVSAGREIRLGSYNVTSSQGAHLIVRGGTVSSAKRNSFVEADPLLERKTVSGGFSYSCPYTVSLKTTSASLGNNPEIVFKGTTNINSSLVDYTIECEGFNGVSASFTGSCSQGVMTVKTSGIPAKRLADSFKVRAVIKSKTDPAYYIASEEIPYCPAENLGGFYSKNAGFDKLLVSLLNYGSVAQTVFNSASADKLANRYIPMSERSSKFEQSQAVKAVAAPSVKATGALSFNSYALDFSTGDRLSILLRASVSDSDVRLLVFSYSEYQQLKKANSSVSDADLLTLKYCKTVISSDGKGAFRFSGFSAKQYADTFICRLVKGSGNSAVYSEADSFSVTKYCERIINDGVTDPTDDLCRAICEYSAAAREYFGYTINGN